MTPNQLLQPGVSGGGALRHLASQALSYAEMYPGNAAALEAFFVACGTAVATRVVPNLVDPSPLNVGRELRVRAQMAISYAHLYGGAAGLSQLQSFFTDCSIKAGGGGGVVPVGVNAVVLGDSLSQRQWFTTLGGTLTASAGLGVLTLAANLLPQLPGSKVRVVRNASAGSTNTRTLIGEWPITSNPGVRELRFSYTGEDTATAEGNWVASMDSFQEAEGYFNRAQGKLNQRLNLVANLGIDGETTAQILARMSTKVAPLSPDLLIICAGANDLLTAVPQATITANLQAIMDLAVTLATRVIMITPTPLLAGGSVAPALSTYIKSYAASNHPTKISVVDAYTLLVDPASGVNAPLANMLTDGVHWTQNAAVLIGGAVADVIDSLITAPYPVPSGVNRMVNGNLTAVTGGTANGVTYTPGTGHVITPTIIANPNGRGNLQRLTMTYGATVSATPVVMPVVPAALTVGKRVRVWTRLRLESSTGMQACGCRFQMVNPSGTFSIYLIDNASVAQGGTQRVWTQGFDEYLCSSWFTVPAGLTAAEFRLSLGNMAAGGATVSFGEVHVEEAP